MNKFCKALLVCIAALAPLVTWGETPSTDIPSLLEEKHCNLCHAEADVRIGPPYKSIAARYRQDDRDMRIKLLSLKIVNGGGGNWGLVPMIPNKHVDMDEAPAMARWILELE